MASTQDVKPGNVLLNGGVCLLADFGLSCVVPTGEQRFFSGGGTLWYQPPECLLLQQQQQLKQRQEGQANVEQDADLIQVSIDDKVCLSYRKTKAR